ncbi:transketolase [Anaerocolumna aminovalerica]|uniref:Transketolase n=2 Tax=Anaerocolumna aminovalerica TaxID=1527 RepID=A0A1I5J6P4_9FIRM|nr:transketolase [Anaerocolumna aminovalerica]MBU5334254.1 transketolase [Anaerocolumna aminovalerica]MDU6266457.1 transketolase [Anaerocolumna aminovalerica]SFO68056.1 transketolase [Anaerocolumna aminovalerica]
MDYSKEKQLSLIAEEVRINVLDAVTAAGSGHIGGSLSIADILTVLYFDEMNVDTTQPRWQERDRLVLSKGHCSPALYGVLAEKGFIPKEELKNFRNIHSMLSGHVEYHVPGVDMSTGSLGQGLSAAVGMSLAAGVDKKDYRVYAILGDGEIEEGQVWEAAMCAGFYKLDNLVAIIDNNNLQIDGTLDSVMSSYPIDKKFEAFNWNVINVDGHNVKEIKAALDLAKEKKGMPTAIIAKTVKGKGVSFMENEAGWHGKATNQEQHDEAVAEIKKRIKELEEK